MLRPHNGCCVNTNLIFDRRHTNGYGRVGFQGDCRVIYQPDRHQRKSSTRRQAVRRHYLQRPIRLKSVARMQQAARRFLGSILALTGGRKRLGMAATVATTLSVIGLVVLPVWAGVNRPDPIATELNIPLQLPPAEALAVAEIEASVSALETDLFVTGESDGGWQVVTVRRNETLGNIFSRLGLSHALMHRLLENDNVRKLTQIHPGDQIAFRIPAEGTLTGMQFDRSESERIFIEIADGRVSERIIERPLERRTQYGSAVITSSLFGAGDAAGLSDIQVMRLAEVFNYDIDFAQDLREGDRFAVVYESIYRDGIRLRDGDILAAVFINQGKRYEAFRYTGSDGRNDFYNGEGRSLRRAFIRTPVEFTRISSRFSSARKHPILGRVRAHQGVDYAAPTGTPVRAAGAGTITFVGTKNGYGKTIELQHGKDTSTLYAHLSRFGKVARGTKVQQGEVIGYVGMTGLATAPHLHYEFRVKGVHRDPLSVTLPKAEPLTGTEMAAFRKAQTDYATALAVVEGQTLVQR